MLRRRQRCTAARVEVAPKALVGGKVADRLLQDRVVGFCNERLKVLRHGILIEILGERRRTDIGELGLAKPRGRVGELQQLPVLIEIFMREIDAVEIEHVIEVLCRSRDGGEIGGIAPPQLPDQVEREGKLAFGTARDFGASPRP